MKSEFTASAKPTASTSTALGCQWSRKRAAKQNSSQDEAAAKLAALVDNKRVYYSELLEMRRAEHQGKLEVLDVKQQYYASKLQKLKEE